MYYLIHLLLPAVVSLILIIAGGQQVLSIAGIEQALNYFTGNYLSLSLPYWIWAAISAYFDTSKNTTVGGFVGLDLLLIFITLLIFISPAPESANAWLLLYVGAPIVVALGAVVGSYLFSSKSSR